MEKTNWGKIFMEVLITVFLTSLFSFILSNFINSNQCDISIGTSIKNGNEIMTPITIKNNSKNIKIEDLDISVGEYNEITSVISNLSHLEDKDKRIITLSYIPPKDTVSLILITNEIVNLDTVKIAYNGNINTTYLEDKSSTYILIISQAIIYGIMLIILKFFQERLFNKTTNKIDEIQKKQKKAQW